MFNSFSSSITTTTTTTTKHYQKYKILNKCNWGFRNKQAKLFLFFFYRLVSSNTHIIDFLGNIFLCVNNFAFICFLLVLKLKERERERMCENYKYIFIIDS